MDKKQGINSKKLMKTVFWAARLVLVLFFGKKLLLEEDTEGEKGSDVSGNEGASSYRENDGDEIQRGVTIISHGGEKYVQTSASGSWGLGFGAEGSESQPTGSLSKEELKKYDAGCLGDEAEKVL